MIARVRKGNSFTGLIRYLMKGGRGEVISLCNLSSDTPEEAASEMAVAAAQSFRTTRPVMHVSVSYANGENPCCNQMQDDAMSLLRSLGLSNNQAVVVAHNDRDHTHFHIAANRVDADGKAVSDSNSYAKTEATLREIEVERGWAVVEGRNAPTPTMGHRKTGPRKVPSAFRVDVPDGVRKALQKAESWSELHRDIRRDGWSLSIVKKGKGSGALLTGPEGQKIGAGTIDRSASLSQLRRRLGRDPTATREAAMNTARRELPRAARVTLVGITSPFQNSATVMPWKRSPGRLLRKTGPFSYR